MLAFKAPLLSNNILSFIRQFNKKLLDNSDNPCVILHVDQLGLQSSAFEKNIPIISYTGLSNAYVRCYLESQTYDISFYKIFFLNIQAKLRT